MMAMLPAVLAHGSGIDDLLLTGLATFGFLFYSVFKVRRSAGEGDARIPESCGYCGERAGHDPRCSRCGFRLRRGPTAVR
jgi:hypothetical protein